MEDEGKMGEEKMVFEPVQIHVQVGDVISSEKGMLQRSSLTGKTYKVTRMRYLGDGKWKVLGEKEEMDDVQRVEG